MSAPKPTFSPFSPPSTWVRLRLLQTPHVWGVGRRVATVLVRPATAAIPLETACPRPHALWDALLLQGHKWSCWVARTLSGCRDALLRQGDEGAATARVSRPTCRSCPSVREQAFYPFRSLVVPAGACPTMPAVRRQVHPPGAATAEPAGGHLGACHSMTTRACRRAGLIGASCRRAPWRRQPPKF